MKLITKPEYLAAVPRLSKKDKKKLKNSLLEHGQLVPIVCNSAGIILDGYTRIEILQKLEKRIKYKVKDFKTLDEEYKFVIFTNIARRQLNTFQKIELGWPIFEIEKKRAEIRWRMQGNVKKDPKTHRFLKDPNRPKKEGTAAMLFGKQIGIGKTLINKVEYLKKHADNKTLVNVRNNIISIDKAFDLLRGMRLIPMDQSRPDKPIKFCPECNTETTSAKRIKCHIHKWFCCTHCKWGI